MVLFTGSLRPRPQYEPSSTHNHYKHYPGVHKSSALVDRNIAPPDAILALLALAPLVLLLGVDIVLPNTLGVLLVRGTV